PPTPPHKGEGSTPSARHDGASTAHPAHRISGVLASPQPVDSPQNTLPPPHRLTYTPARIAARAASPPRARDLPQVDEARGMLTLNSSLPGLTRQSIFFARSFREEDGPAGQARG